MAAAQHQTHSPAVPNLRPACGLGHSRPNVTLHPSSREIPGNECSRRRCPRRSRETIAESWCGLLHRGPVRTLPARRDIRGQQNLDDFRSRRVAPATARLPTSEKSDTTDPVRRPGRSVRPRRCLHAELRFDLAPTQGTAVPDACRFLGRCLGLARHTGWPCLCRPSARLVLPAPAAHYKYLAEL